MAVGCWLKKKRTTEFFARSESKTNAKDTQFSSKAHGTRNSKSINLEGRLQMDVLQIMQRDHKLRSYTLNAVCAHFLGKFLVGSEM